MVSGSRSLRSLGRNNEAAAARRAIEAVPSIPRDAEGPVFREPWEAQAFAMTLALHERGALPRESDRPDVAIRLGDERLDGDQLDIARRPGIGKLRGALAGDEGDARSTDRRDAAEACGVKSDPLRPGDRERREWRDRGAEEVRPEDGRVIMDLYLVEVKKPAESRHPNDYYRILSTVPGEKVFVSLADSECPLVKK